MPAQSIRMSQNLTHMGRACEGTSRSALVPIKAANDGTAATKMRLTHPIRHSLIVSIQPNPARSPSPTRSSIASSTMPTASNSKERASESRSKPLKINRSLDLPSPQRQHEIDPCERRHGWPASDRNTRPASNWNACRLRRNPQSEGCSASGFGGVEGSEAHTNGTSAGAAIASRTAYRIHDALSDVCQRAPRYIWQGTG